MLRYVGMPPIYARSAVSRSGDGNTNGIDLSSGQSSAAAASLDTAGNGQIRGQDDAPGQIPANGDQ